MDTMKLTSSLTDGKTADMTGEALDHISIDDGTANVSPSRDDTSNAADVLINNDGAMMQQELGGDAPMIEDDPTMDLGM